ncbi:MAG: hypothetical protein CM1200mP18_05950 [Gammaproteobacteria bacterium]|nr:MAG: hypothetical protein CM1200mP18_05950 [Gammaproteobacteria bacterium]
MAHQHYSERIPGRGFNPHCLRQESISLLLYDGLFAWGYQKVWITLFRWLFQAMMAKFKAIGF